MRVVLLGTHYCTVCSAEETRAVVSWIRPLRVYVRTSVHSSGVGVLSTETPR